jgi:hypothetical protein
MISFPIEILMLYWELNMHNLMAVSIESSPDIRLRLNETSAGSVEGHGERTKTLDFQQYA